MRFFNIKNLLPGSFKSGNLDYKGLDIGQFIPGSQVYTYGVSECVVATNENWEGSHPDVIELTQEEYEAKVEELKATYPDPEQTPDEMIAQQQEQINALNIAMAALLGGEA